MVPDEFGYGVRIGPAITVGYPDGPETRAVTESMVYGCAHAGYIFFWARLSRAGALIYEPECCVDGGALAESIGQVSKRVRGFSARHGWVVVDVRFQVVGTCPHAPAKGSKNSVPIGTLPIIGDAVCVIDPDQVGVKA